jgi:uncharacterized protein (TIGR03435 family)
VVTCAPKLSPFLQDGKGAEMALHNDMSRVGRAAFLCSLACLRAQSPAADNSARAFEVASVKPSNCGQCGLARTTPGGEGYRAEGATLRILMSVAYRVDVRQISGGPSWLAADRFDISAKAARPGTPEELHAMLRSLLEERFHLKVRHESRQESVWNLVVAKDGVKMPVHDPGDTDYPPIHGQAKDAPGGGRCPGLAGQNVSMDSFVRALTRLLGRPVFDKTGLASRYDLSVIFAGEGARSGGGAASANPNCPDAFSALPSQLGLKLEAAKGSVEYLIVEHAEKPSEN